MAVGNVLRSRVHGSGDPGLVEVCRGEGLMHQAGQSSPLPSTRKGIMPLCFIQFLADIGVPHEVSDLPSR